MACAEGLSWWYRGLGALPLPDGLEVSCRQWGTPGSQRQAEPRTSGAPSTGRSPDALLAFCLV